MHYVHESTSATSMGVQDNLPRRSVTLTLGSVTSRHPMRVLRVASPQGSIMMPTSQDALRYISCPHVPPCLLTVSAYIVLCIVDGRRRVLERVAAGTTRHGEEPSPRGDSTGLAQHRIAPLRRLQGRRRLPVRPRRRGRVSRRKTALRARSLLLAWRSVSRR